MLFLDYLGNQSDLKNRAVCFEVEFICYMTSYFLCFFCFVCLSVVFHLNWKWKWVLKNGTVFLDVNWVHLLHDHFFFFLMRYFVSSLPWKWKWFEERNSVLGCGVHLLHHEVFVCVCYFVFRLPWAEGGLLWWVNLRMMRRVLQCW